MIDRSKRIPISFVAFAKSWLNDLDSDLVCLRCYLISLWMERVVDDVKYYDSSTINRFNNVGFVDGQRRFFTPLSANKVNQRTSENAMKSQPNALKHQRLRSLFLVINFAFREPSWFRVLCF